MVVVHDMTAGQSNLYKMYTSTNSGSPHRNQSFSTRFQTKRHPEHKTPTRSPIRPHTDTAPYKPEARTYFETDRPQHTTFEPIRYEINRSTVGLRKRHLRTSGLRHER